VQAQLGNSFLWAFKDGPFKGNLHLVDDQEIELSNLQRYVLALQDGLARYKVEVMAEMFLSSRVKIIPHRCTWREFVQSFSLSEVGSVVSAVDSAETRIEIQAALPKTIFNGWTGNESLGVSRHTDFREDACLACLYLPSHEKPSYSQMVAEALNMADLERQIVRDYLANHKAIDRSLLNIIAERKTIPVENLLSFEGRLLPEFFTEAVCGSRIIQMQSVSGKVPSEVEVPLSFESALAGILLASEVVIDSMGGRADEIPSLTKINLLKPLSPYSTEIEDKHFSGACICQDEIFKRQYERKWR
jgi:molybdopterin/thiamine biosynthesis adenylyltransferase